MGNTELINKLRSTAGALARKGNHEARDLMNLAADRLQRMADRTADSDAALIKRLLAIAEMGIVNHGNDVPVILDAADRIEELSERVAIMAEGNALSGPSGQLPQRGSREIIGPGANVDLCPALERISRDEGQITMDEMLKGGAP